jgi:hypothetical protein
MAFLSRNKRSRVPSDPVTNAVPYDKHPPSLLPQSNASPFPSVADQGAGSPPPTSTTESRYNPHPHPGHTSITLPTNLIYEFGDDEDAAKERVGKLAMGRDSPEPRASFSKKRDDEQNRASTASAPRTSKIRPIPFF